MHYPTDVFAARNSNGVYFPRIGEEGIAQRLFADTKPADSVPTDPLDAGEIGILDLPTAVRFQLPIANLTNGVGQPVVAPNAWSLTAGYNAMKTSPGGLPLRARGRAGPERVPAHEGRPGDGARSARPAPTRTCASARSSTTRSAPAR